MKILIVEDERAIAETLKALIETNGDVAKIASDGAMALDMFEEDNYDLILLDLMLPEISGIDVCRAIRKKSQVPIIMLTAMEGEESVVAGLDAGASDYIIKPWKNKELLARIRANTRKASVDASSEYIKVGESLKIDTKNYTVIKNGVEIPLTRNEYVIFSTMASKPDKTWSRDDLITYALGYEYDGFERSIDSYIKNLRKKLSDPEHETGYIKTVHGFGYRVIE